MTRMIKYIKKYGLSVFLWKGLSNGYSPTKYDNKLSRWLLKQKHHSILRYISMHYASSFEIDAIVDTAVERNPYPDCIWTAWLQGEDKVPEVIRMTIASMRKNAGNHQVIVLTADSIADFVDVPQIIREKHDCGIISHAHYMDVVRMMVLARYGGLWLDATILMTQPLDEKVFSYPFYSIRRNQPNSVYVTEGQWIVGILGGKYHSFALSRISDLLTQYWVEHDQIVDYFIFDYLIAALLQMDHAFAKALQGLPVSKANIHGLKAIINDTCNTQELQCLCAETSMFYLPHRKQYHARTQSGEMTYYGYLLKYFLGSSENE